MKNIMIVLSIIWALFCFAATANSGGGNTGMFANLILIGLGLLPLLIVLGIGKLNKKTKE